MEITLKLDTRTKSLTKKGYPIVLYLYKDRKNWRYKSIKYYSFTENWNNKLNNVKKSHHNFMFLFDYLDEIKTSCIRVENLSAKNFMTFDDAINAILKLKTGLFYENAILKCSEFETSVLKSFNAIFPNCEINDLTPEVAKKYMDVILTKQANNGVHSYMRTLNSIANRLGIKPNPFEGIRPTLVRTKQKSLQLSEMRKIKNTCTIVKKPGSISGGNHYRNYFLLMFYLGGIDFVDLANLTNKNVIGDRIQFTRGKAGSNEFVNVKIFPEAQAILDQYNCEPYLIPVFQASSYKTFSNNMGKRFRVHLEDLKLSRDPLLKTPRYTFINIGKQLVIDERIVKEIVGHASNNTHSIYQEQFPEKVRDEAHKRIIDEINKI